MKKLLNVLTIFIMLALIFASVSFANTGTLKDTDFLNVRESPSTSSNIVTVLPANASFDIIAEEGDWYQIQYQDYTGYVSKQYVEVSETVANTDIPARANSNGIVNQNSSIYVLPLLNSTVVGTVNSGTEVLVISITGKWAYIQTDTASGWIFTDNVNGTEDSNLGDGDNTSNNSDSGDNNQADNNEGNNQGDTNGDSNNGSTSSDYPKTMYVNVDAVYIRAQPTTESNAVASVGLNTPVTVRGEEGDWYSVSVTDGDGYMMKQYLSETRQ